MPYKIFKFNDDRRNHTCGFQIPNGGWYHVVELTFENMQQVRNIANIPNYGVAYVDGPTGFFDPDGKQVDIDSIEVDKNFKHVTDYEVIRKTKAKHEDKERDQLIQECKEKGIQIDKRWGTQKIKDIVESAKHPGYEGSVVVG